MKPDKVYKGRSTIRMYRGDCMEFMKGKSENHWDLAIVDPPYGNNAIFNGSADYANKHKGYENKAPDQNYFNSLSNKSTNQVIWGGNYFNLPPSRGFIFWYKKQPFDNYSDGEFAWTSFDKVARCFEHAYYGNINADKNGRMHPTQKPVKLYRWLLANYAEEGDTILDTHGGSMSIAIACWEEGFDLDICELDKDYFKAAVKRFEQHISQKQLF